MSTVTTNGGQASLRTTDHATLGGYLLALGAAVAFGLTAWRYLTPLSGITGTPGALIAMFGEAALFVAGIALALMARGAGRTVFVVLAWIGIALTLFAAILLHGWWSAAALVVALAGLVAASFAAPRTERRTA